MAKSSLARLITFLPARPAASTSRQDRTYSIFE